MERETILEQTQLEQDGTVLEKDVPTLPGWKTVKRLGGGSFGAVYEIHRDVAGSVEKAAMKLISIPKDRDEIQRLYSEGYNSHSITAHFENCLNATLKEYALIIDLKGHPNIVRSDDIYHVRQKNGAGWDIYIKMELLNPLGDFLGSDYDEKQVIRLGRDICNALMACEENKIIHRDIKPANILVAKDGTCKLGDFGVARISEQTYAKTLAGSFDYMSPEVYHGRGYDHRADIYSLGIVLYWMMNHKRGPFLPQGGAVPTASMVENARGRRFTGEALPRPVNGSEELWKIVQKACAYDPKKRYASAADMKKALDALDSGIQPPPPPPPWKLIAMIAGGILAAMGLFFAFGQEKDPCAKGHTWMSATCVSAQSCGKCGITNGVPLGHEWRTADCDSAKTCAVCGITDGAPLGHRWTDASCEAPRTCTVCGSSDGAPLGHSWIAATCEAAKTCSLCGAAEGEPLEHQWNPATCEAAESCGLCGAARGEALGHAWSEATCAEPAKCQRCGELSGDMPSHTWTAATFVAPKTCSGCGATEGTAVPYAHLVVEDEVVKIRNSYNDIVSNIQNNAYRKTPIRDGVDGYYDASGMLVCAVVYRGTPGIGTDSDTYSRTYYYVDGKLIFAFFEGYDSHRLYFYEELLLRWRHRTSEITHHYNLTFTDSFFAMEKKAKDESATFFGG